MKNNEKIKYSISSASNSKTVWYNASKELVEDQSMEGIHRVASHNAYIKLMHDTFTKHITYTKYDGGVVTIEEINENIVDNQ